MNASARQTATNRVAKTRHSTSTPKKPATSVGEPLMLSLDEGVEVLQLPSKQMLYTMIRRKELPEACVIRLGPRRIRLRKQILLDWIRGDFRPAGAGSTNTSDPKQAA